MKISKLAKALNDEILEFGSLEDTRENIEAPLEQLNAKGKKINLALNKIGITNQLQLDLLDELLTSIIALNK